MNRKGATRADGNVAKVPSGAQTFLVTHQAAFYDDAAREPLRAALADASVDLGGDRHRFSDGSFLTIDPYTCAVTASEAATDCKC